MLRCAIETGDSGCDGCTVNGETGGSPARVTHPNKCTRHNYSFYSPGKMSTPKATSNSIMKSAVAAVAALTSGSSFHSIGHNTIPNKKKANLTNSNSNSNSTNVPTIFKRDSSVQNDKSSSACAPAAAAGRDKIIATASLTNNSLLDELTDGRGDNSYDCQSDEILELRAVTHTLPSTELSASPMYTQVRKKTLHSAASSSPDDETFPSEYTLLNESNTANGELDYRLILQLH